VDRVPIEYADYSHKPAESVIPENIFFNQPTQMRKRSIDERKRSEKTNTNGTGTNNEKSKNNRFQGKYTMEELNSMLDNGRFFIMRSSNADNINTARAYNEWATTIPNEHKLKEAYKSGKYVFLVYAVSKSYEFQGFARMAGPVSNNMRLWRNDSNIKLGGSFKLEWIADIPLSFNKILNMTNPLNDNDYVRKSKDGTEIEPSVGKELCLMFNINYKPETGEMNLPKLPGHDKGHIPTQMMNYMKHLQNLQGKDSLEQDTKEQIKKFAMTNDLPGMMGMIKIFSNLKQEQSKVQGNSEMEKGNKGKDGRSRSHSLRRRQNKKKKKTKDGKVKKKKIKKKGKKDKKAKKSKRHNYS
jgi:hypothetical protein